MGAVSEGTLVNNYSAFHRALHYISDQSISRSKVGKGDSGFRWNNESFLAILTSTVTWRHRNCITAAK